jgi:enoyl-CoA hydratase/carnithine racemase
MTGTPEADEESIRTDLRAGVLTVTLDRPGRKNALDLAAFRRLAEVFRSVARDSEIRAVVLAGAGGDFCAGADVADDLTGHHPLRRMEMINEAAQALHDLPMPTIASVAGVAVGAGWNLALGCDLVVAERDARFAQIFAKRGLSVDFGGSWLLPRLVGLQQAKRLALLAELISAQEASDLGLVTFLVEPGEADARAAELAGQLAIGPAVALAQTKRLLNDGLDATLRDSLEAEARAQSVNFGGTDAAAAFEAFLAKREPEFTGEWAFK